MKTLFRGLVAAACATTLLAQPALAAPTTVDLRIEGPTRTLFEGPVTTDVRTFRFSDESTQHRCDGTADDTAAPNPSPQPTRGGAIATASEQHGFSMIGSWFNGLGASFEEINGENVAFDGGTNRYLVEYENWQVAGAGACGDPIASGDTVLFAYGDGSEPLLRLSGPAVVRPGEPFAVKVVDGRNGAAIDGAAVGGATTNGAGDASVTLNARGPQALKASKAGTIRSNALQVCVSDGSDGQCGSAAGGGAGPSTGTAAIRDLVAPRASITGVREGRVYRRGAGPRVLRGKVAESGGIFAVKLKLTRTDRGRCSTWSKTRERFIGSRCGARRGVWFSIGDRANWEYQLAERLPRGRYVLDVNAIDQSYNRDDQRRRGQNRVVFKVR